MKNFGFLMIVGLIITTSVQSEAISQKEAKDAADEVFSAVGKLYLSKVKVDDFDGNGIPDFEIVIIQDNENPPLWVLFITTKAAIRRVTKKTSWKSDKVFLVVNEKRGGGIYRATTADCRRKCSKSAANIDEYAECEMSIWEKGN